MPTLVIKTIVTFLHSKLIHDQLLSNIRIIEGDFSSGAPTQHIVIADRIIVRHFQLIRSALVKFNLIDELLLGSIISVKGHIATDQYKVSVPTVLVYIRDASLIPKMALPLPAYVHVGKMN